jgi:hypothetical protein
LKVKRNVLDKLRASFVVDSENDLESECVESVGDQVGLNESDCIGDVDLFSFDSIDPDFEGFPINE